MCYTERDTLEVMLTKTGTITQTATKARVHQDEAGEDPFPAAVPSSSARRGSARAAEKEDAEPRGANSAMLVRQDAKGGVKKKKADQSKQKGAMVSRNGGGDVEMV